MKRLWLLVTLSLAIQSGYAAQHTESYAFFPDLAKKVLSGNPKAFRRVIERAQTTLPGERLEELAELSSRYVRLAPTEFLRAQMSTEGCFGVEFMGPDYVDDPDAAHRELDMRREALESVKDPTLSVVKQRCLSQLAGS